MRGNGKLKRAWLCFKPPAVIEWLVFCLKYDCPYGSLEINSSPDIKFENTLYGAKQNKGF